MIGLGKYVGISSLAAGAVLYHAFATREQFYPAMQYLTSSKLAIAVMGNLSFALALCTYRLLTKIFLGSLREAEVERVNERISQAVMETCLAMTIFREEFNISFVAMFATLTFVKVFHWLVQDRVDYVETTPSISVLQHVRILSFMCLLLVVDNMFLQYTITETIKHGPSVLLLFAFEYVIQASVVVSTALKYGLIFVDNAMEGRWESKGVYVFYLELITDMFHLFVYLLFFVIVFSYYGLPLHLVRDLYWTFRNFRQRVSDFLRYRRVTANMNERFPNATPEDLARCDNTCIICREEMAPEGANKKLPCGHVFHLPCLRSWLERQQNCPTCRANVLTAPGAADNNRRPPAAAAADENNNAEAAPGAEAQAAAEAAPGAAAAAAQQPADAHVQAPGAARAAPAPAAPQPHPAEPPAAANLTRGSLRHRHPQAPGTQQGQARQQQQPRPRHQSRTQQASGAAAAAAASSGGGGSARRRPQQPPGQHQYQYQQQHPGMAAWYPLHQQYAGQQYAGQQPPIAVSMPGGSMPTMSVPMVPMQLLMPQHAVAVPAYSGSATPEQHQAAVAAAAAAAAAVCNPWSGMMGGMLMMPPTMVPIAQPRRSQRPQEGGATAASGSSSSSGASASTGMPSASAAAASCSTSTAPASSAAMGPSTVAAATATAAAAAAASAATAAAMMSSSPSQTPSTAVQVLRSHIEYLQSQIRTIEGTQTAQSEGTSQQEAATTEKGKEKVPAEEAPASSSAAGDRE